MCWQYGDPIVVGDIEIELGSDDYEALAALEEIVAGEYDGSEDVWATGAEFSE